MDVLTKFIIIVIIITTLNIYLIVLWDGVLRHNRYKVGTDLDQIYRGNAL